jgi:hypothetical protein
MHSHRNQPVCVCRNRKLFNSCSALLQDLDPLFNAEADSIRDIYLRNSYGKLTINSQFTDWITVSMTEVWRWSC